MAHPVDYALVRKAVLKDLRSGRLQLGDVCDAHPELIRAAKNIGCLIAAMCPLCETNPLVHVSYVYGDKLQRANGRCITRPEELAQLGEKYDEFTCYVIEVCTECGWNHLATKYLLGRTFAS